MGLSISWLVHHMQGRRNLLGRWGQLPSPDLRKSRSKKASYGLMLLFAPLPEFQTILRAWYGSLQLHGAINKEIKELPFDDCRQLSPFVYCHRSIWKEIRHFWNEKYLPSNFISFLYIIVQIEKKSTKEVSVARILTRSKFGSNSIFAMCHFIVGLKSEVE